MANPPSTSWPERSTPSRSIPSTLKGKADPVPAYRLLAVHEAPERRHDTPFVGRERDLATIRDVWRRVVEERSCQLVTIVGDAGIGKSRLASEALATIDARTLYGRCLPYGEGITYWPVVEVLKQLNARPADDRAADAISALLGESDAPTSADEIAWAFRKTLEHAAAERPLVVVFDDIQWGEETFRDLIEHVALLSAGAAILLLCMARPELSERRPTWPVTLRLEPLDDDDVDELISERIPGDLRARIARAASGNPLFIGEILAMADQNGDVVVPPTLQALLAARLDELDPAERSVLERGAIEGETFHRGAVQALASGGTQVTPHLAALVRKQLIKPDRPQLAGEDGFRFRHLLLRDAAYEALPKAVRADLHERYGTWLEQHGTELVEQDEVLGYHLEQACRYRIDLGADNDQTRELAHGAGRKLAAAGRRAHARGDDGATSALLERATRLLSDGDEDLPSLLALLGASIYEAGDTSTALDSLRRAQVAAAAMSQRGVELGARMDELAIRVRGDLASETAAVLAEAEAAVVELEQLDDRASLARAWRAVIEIGFVSDNFGMVGEASKHLLANARLTGIRRDEVWAVRGLAAALTYGPTPVEEAIPRVEHALAAFPQERAGEDHLALLYACAGRFDDAEQAMERSRRVRMELGQNLDLAYLSFNYGWIALLAGRPERAEPVLRAAADTLQRRGDSEIFGGIAAILAEVLYQLGRETEAEDWVRKSEHAAPHEPYWGATRAKMLARRGETDEALRLSAEAVALARGGDCLMDIGDALRDQAEVFRLLGRHDEERSALEEALVAYERKGIVPSIDAREPRRGARRSTRRSSASASATLVWETTRSRSTRRIER